MKRKTNLFYTEGADSKFITFSNYTESLTGNFLSTNTKLFPSRFLCAYINGLTEKSKSLLITKLVEYYESKLAVLRDNFDNPENNIAPLNYLLEFLYSITTLNNNTIEFNSYTPGAIDDSNLELTSDIISIPYVSDIVEQDFNGTFTDTIMNVDLDTQYKATIYLSENDSSNAYNISIDRPYNSSTYSYCLYGWETTKPVSNYTYSYSYFDNIVEEEIDNDITYLYEYRSTSYLSYINLTKVQDNILEFNTIIPLFDVCNINYTVNNTPIEDLGTIDLINSNSNDLYTKNVPLGMWFSYDGIPVTLRRDANTGFSGSWSLVLGSQFKPFPTSSAMPSEISATSNSNAFATFSQVLNKENDIMDRMQDLIYEFTYLSNRIDKIESKIKHIGLSYNIDDIKAEMAEFTTDMKSNFSDLKEDVLSYLSNMQWKATI